MATEGELGRDSSVTAEVGRDDGGAGGVGSDAANAAFCFVLRALRAAPGAGCPCRILKALPRWSTSQVGVRSSTPSDRSQSSTMDVLHKKLSPRRRRGAGTQ